MLLPSLKLGQSLIVGRRSYSWKEISNDKKRMRILSGRLFFALEWDTAVPHYQITVEAENGWLILKGEVDAPQHKSAAETAVSCLTGVEGVRNLITVNTTGPYRGSFTR